MRVALVGVLLLFCAGVVAADKPVPVAPSIVLNEADPALGDSLTFAVTFSSKVEKFGPRIQVLCYQGGIIVYGESGPYYQAFQLGGGSSPWLNDTPPADRESPAHCTADLYYWSYHGWQKFNWLASTEFDAAGL